MKKTIAAKFQVGQVVRIHTPYYRTKRKGEQYQRIIKVFPWTPWPGYGQYRNIRCPSFGYQFLNGDEANEKYVKPLTVKEVGT